MIPGMHNNGIAFQHVIHGPLQRIKRHTDAGNIAVYDCIYSSSGYMPGNRTVS